MPAPSPNAPAPRWALVGLSLSMLLSSFGTSAANVALPDLAATLEVPFHAVQWVVLAYLLALTSSIAVVGRLGDLVGRRRLLGVGLCAFTAASALAGVASSLGLLIVARAVQGLGAAAMMALTVAFVSDIVPRGRTGAAMGLLGTMSAVGTALGPALGGALIDLSGWRAIFLVNVPLGLLAAALVRRQLPADGPAAKTRRAFDTRGAALLALSLTAYALAMTLERGRITTIAAALLAVAALGAALFVRVEARAAHPLVRLAMFSDRELTTGLASSLLVATVIMTTLVVGPFYLARALHLDAGAVGLAMAMGPLVSALTGLPAGRLVDRYGTRRMTLFGLGGILLGATLLSLGDASLGVAGYVLPLGVLTCGYATFQAANNTGVMQGVGRDERGAVSGILSLSRNLGLITGAAVMGAVFSGGVGTGDVTSAPADLVAAATRTTFAVSAGLVAVALIGVVSRRALPARAAEPTDAR